MINDTVTNGVVRDGTLSRKGIIALSAMALLVLGSAPGSGMPPAQTPEAEAAYRALYNVDFEPAREVAEAMTRREPDNPESWNLLASTIWLDIVFRQEKLNLDSFVGESLGTEDSNEVVSEEEERRLRQAIDRAAAAANALLDRNPENLEALYQLGVAYGTLSTFEALAKESYRAANSAGSRAREIHVDLLRKDPSFNDARLTVGAYDYAVGSLPWIVRVLAGVVGIRGDKEEGIQQLEWAAELGKRARTNARMVLVVVYNREKRYDESLALLEELHESYPRNYLIEIAIGGVHERTKRWTSAIRVYESVLAKIDGGIDDYDRFERAPVTFRLAEAHVHGERFMESVPIFERVIRDPESSDGLRCRSHLWSGRILQDRDQEPRAAEHFRAIQQLDCSSNQKREARRYL
jgi:tetratricopeptide (TPR) repeat protein